MEKLEQRDNGSSVTVTMTFRRPEHEAELREALNASRYLAVIWNLQEWLRMETKHTEDEKKIEYFGRVRDKLWQSLEDEGISLEG